MYTAGVAGSNRHCEWTFRHEHLEEHGRHHKLISAVGCAILESKNNTQSHDINQSVTFPKDKPSHDKGPELAQELPRRFPKSYALKTLSRMSRGYREISWNERWEEVQNSEKGDRDWEAGGNITDWAFGRTIAQWILKASYGYEGLNRTIWDLPSCGSEGACWSWAALQLT